MRISVLATPGEHGEVVPRCLHLGKRRVPVVAILERWEAMTHQYYQVRDLDGRRFVLRYEPDSRNWELTAVYGRRG
jgi:hypothetical protein